MRRAVTTGIVSGILLAVPRLLLAEQAKTPAPEPNMARVLPSRHAVVGLLLRFLTRDDIGDKDGFADHVGRTLLTLRTLGHHHP